jgi:RsiW-degrading membrane proteinase PrsW (M82 family)
MAIEDVGLATLLLVAFVPPLAFMVRIRNAEHFDRNPWWLMLFVFAWGAVGAIVIAVVGESWLGIQLDTYRPQRVPTLMWLAVLLGPLVEEPAKAVILVFLSKRRMREEEDGLVYGAAAGLGFSATENLAYELQALATHGFAGWLATSIMRMLTSTLLHASCSAVAGWGIARGKLQAGVDGSAWKYLAVAMLMHGLFNFLATLPLLFADSFAIVLGSLLAVFVFASAIYRFIRGKIRELDRRGRALGMA